MRAYLVCPPQCPCASASCPDGWRERTILGALSFPWAGGGARSKGRGVSVVGSPGAPEGSLGRYQFRLEEEEEGEGECVGRGRLTGSTARATSGLAGEERRSPCRGAVHREREAALAFTREAAREVEHRKNASKEQSLPNRLLPASPKLSSIYPPGLLLSCIATERSVVPFPPLFTTRLRRQARQTVPL